MTERGKMKLFTLLVMLVFLTSCVSTGGDRSYFINESRDGIYKFEISLPFSESITLPGDPDAWTYVGKQSGWHTFNNVTTDEAVQYVNSGKSSFEFYSDDLNNNSNFINKYYEWESEYLQGFGIVDRVDVVEKEINKEDRDYILIDVVRNDGINNFIYFSIKKGRVVGASLKSSDQRDIVLNKIKGIYNSTKTK